MRVRRLATTIACTAVTMAAIGVTAVPAGAVTATRSPASARTPVRHQAPLVGPARTVGAPSTNRTPPPTDQKAHPGRLIGATPGYTLAPAAAPRFRAHAATATPTTPYNECPAIGRDNSCGILVQVADGVTNVYADSSQGPYDGSDDTLVGITNQSSRPLGSIALRGSTNIFGFDGDGICTYSGGPPCGPTGYEGTNNTFSDISSDTTSGVVDFTTPLGPGQSTYFSLEEALQPTSVQTGSGQTVVTIDEQGGAPNASENNTTCSTPRPVNCGSGEFWHQFDDLRLPGRGVALDFGHGYTSGNAATNGPLGYGWTDSYNMSTSTDGSGNVTVHQADGSIVTFTTNGGSFVAPTRVLATLTSDGHGGFIFTRLQSHLSYLFNSAGQLTSEQDRNGYVTSLMYASGLLSSVTDPAGRVLTLSNDSSGRITKAADPLGRSVNFGYDTVGNLSQATDANGGVTTFSYDAHHLLTSMTDPRGSITSQVYNTGGQVTQQTDPLGRATAFAYSGDNTSDAGGTTTQSDPNGSQTVYGYIDLQLQSVTHAANTSLAATTSYSYDPFTLGLTSITDPNGNSSSRTYDRAGDLLSQADALGRTTKYSYDSRSDLLSRTEPTGALTSYSYDGNGNPLSATRSVTGSNGSQAVTTAYSYDDGSHPGDFTKVTDPSGNVTTLAYDTNGYKLSNTDALGDKTSYTYDAAGRQTAMTSPRGNVTGANPAAYTTHYSHDAVGNLLSSTDALGRTTTTAFDADGNRTSSTDAAGKTTTNSYDADNELTSVGRPDGSTLTYTYDGNGNQVAQTNGAGQTTSYSYDALSRNSGSTDPLKRTTSYGYDPVGRLTTTTDPTGQVTTDGYDAAGQLTGITYSDGTTPNVAYSFDKDGRRLSMTDGTGVTSYGYDELGRLLSSTNGAGATVGYAYDASGRITQLTYPNGKSVARGYDAGGRLTSVADWLGNTTTYSYDPDGNVINQAYPNGVNATTVTDATNQPTSITDTNGSATLANFAYTRNNLGQVTTDASTGAAPATNAYGYSALNQLGSVNGHTYSYDAADNLTRLSDGTTQTFDAASELTASIPPSATGGGSPGPVAGGPVPAPVTTTPGGSSAAPVVGRPVPVQVSATTASRTPVGIDVSSSTKVGHLVNKLSTPKLTTHHAGELMLAVIAASGPKHGSQRVVKVVGGGLHWTLASRSNTRQGSAEVWQAYASQPVSHASIAATLASKGVGVLSVMSFTGANPSTTLRSTASGKHGKPAVQVSPTTAGSLVIGAGTDSASAAGRHASAGTAIVAQQHATKATYWVQRSSSTLTNGGTAHFATGDSSKSWQVAAVEVTPASARSAAHAVTETGSGTNAITYSNDARGNRIDISPAGASPTVLTYDQANRLTTYGSTLFTYDARGNRTGIASGEQAPTVLSYDQANRLVGYGSQATYAYDGDGLRQRKRLNDMTIDETWDTNNPLPLLLGDGAGYYIYGTGDRAIEYVSGATPTYLLQDRQGSTRLLSDVSGNTVGSYTYGPLGTVTAHSGAAVTLQYDGQLGDEESGFQYLRARYYEPATGNFVSVDPLSRLTAAPYSFAGSNALNASDPSGLWFVGLCGGLVGDLVGGAGLTGSGELCLQVGNFGLAVTGGGSGGVQAGAKAGGNGLVGIDFGGASSPEALAGCTDSVSGGGSFGVGLQGSVSSDCSGGGATSGEVDVTFGPDLGGSAGVGVGRSCVIKSFPQSFSGCSAPPVDDGNSNAAGSGPGSGPICQSSRTAGLLQGSSFRLQGSSYRLQG